MTWVEEKLTSIREQSAQRRKAKDKVGASTYLCLIGDMETQLKRKGMDQSEFYSLVQKHINGILECSNARGYLTPEEEYQLSILWDLLPVKMTEDELNHEVKVVIGEVGADTVRDMGKVMSAFKEKFPGRYDGKALSQIVKSYLK